MQHRSEDPIFNIDSSLRSWHTVVCETPGDIEAVAAAARRAPGRAPLFASVPRPTTGGGPWQTFRLGVGVDPERFIALAEPLGLLAASGAQVGR
jgi:hypothetical protein